MDTRIRQDSQLDRCRTDAPAERSCSDQLFKLKFQLKMGQTESLKKIRD